MIFIPSSRRIPMPDSLRRQLAAELIAAIHQTVARNGKERKQINPKTRIVLETEGFDSQSGVEATLQMEEFIKRVFGKEIDLGVNIFIDEKGSGRAKARNLAEVVSAILATLA